MCVPSECGPHLAGRHVPELDGAALIPRCQGAAVWGEGDGVDPTGMPAEGGSLTASSHVPKLDRLVCSPGCQCPPIGRISHRKDAFPMAPADGRCLPIRNPPHADAVTKAG